MKKTVGILALLAALLLAGCANAGPAGTEPPVSEDQTHTAQPSETAEPAGQTEPLLPTDAPAGPDALAAGETVKLRILGKDTGWWQSFYREDGGCYFLADSVEAFAEGLSSRGIDRETLNLEGYDDAFFAEYRLAVIPRTANSGSVRYSSTLTPTPGGVEIHLDAQMPEYGTADMADFLVLVAVPLADYPAGTAITVDPAGAPTTPGGSHYVSK